MRESRSPGSVRGALGEADINLLVKVWSGQSLASRPEASLAGIAATRGLKRRQRVFKVCYSTS